MLKNLRTILGFLQRVQ